MATAKTYVGGGFRLELEGQDAGPLQSSEGGEPYGEVVELSRSGSSAVPDKYLTSVRYSDIVIQCGLDVSGALPDWISATLQRTSALRRSGAIVELDYKDRELSRLAFHDAIIRQVEFPALDATGKQPAYLTIRIAPETTQHQAVSATQRAKDEQLTAKSRTTRVSDFRLQIAGLNATNVSSVAPLIVRQVHEEASIGTRPQAMAIRLEVPDLVVTVPEAADWYAWRDAFIIAGSGTERTGTLEYLNQGTSRAFAHIDFVGLGIYGLVAERAENGVARQRRVRASMYCEQLRYSSAQGAAFGAASAQSATTAQPAAPAETAPLAQPATPSRVDVIPPLAIRRPFTLAKPA